MALLDVLFPSRVRRRKLMDDVSASRARIQKQFDDITQTLRIDTTDPEYQKLIHGNHKGGA